MTRILRNDAIEIWRAGVDAVLPRPLVQRNVEIDGDQLIIDARQWDRSSIDRLIVVGAGKAATGMAEGLLDRVHGWCPVTGWINVPEGTEKTLPGITVHVARPAGVNEPTEAGVVGTLKMLELVGNAGPNDLCIALISGGGSALMPAPIAGITLEDKQIVTRWLSAAGADITELNTVRKKLSRVKGGGLLRACRAGELVTLILSDVLGDPLDMIASGPTVPDHTTVDDAIGVLQKYDPDQSLPRRIYDCLNQQRNKTLPPPKCRYSTFVIGNNAVAVDHAGICAERLGYNHAMQSATAPEGPAEQVGRHLADMTVQMVGPADQPSPHINCLITGGEPTVTLAPPHQRGKGGRNQQLVLAAYLRALEQNWTDRQWDQLCLLSAGTDGEDGPTDAAGAWIDADVHRQAIHLGIDAADHLRRNDAYTFFQRVGGLFKTGPTGTNVCDLRVAVTQPRSN